MEMIRVAIRVALGFTWKANGGEVLGLVVAVPWYAAENERSPVCGGSTERVATPLLRLAEPSTREPSMKVTTPPGVGPPTALPTVARRVTSCPNTELLVSERSVTG